MKLNERIELYDKYMSVVNRKNKDVFVEWLKNETDFFTAPAASRHHNNFEGGLFDHSMNVLNYARNLYMFSKKNYPDFPDITAESLIICALHHDICKTNYYGKEKSWVKYEYNWIEYEIYKAGIIDDFPFGHGDKSVLMMVQKGFELTNQEMLAIRHHMGHFGGDMNTEIAMKDSLVNLIHLADMCSCMVEKTMDYKELAIQNYLNNQR
jgi:hypothetical protein